MIYKLQEKISHPYNIFFVSAIFFVLGIFLANLKIDFLWITLAVVIVILVLYKIFKNNVRLIFLVILLPAGFFYFSFYNNYLAFDINLENTVFDKPARMIEKSYQQLLAPEKSGLLTGITLGKNDRISYELSNKLSLSGTRHLTALSGLHVSIIVLGFAGMISWFFPGRRRTKFIALIVFSLLFIVLTGLRVSAIRASFMAMIIGLSQVSERIYKPRNSIAFAGLILLLANPNWLVFDIGFQLSFLAVTGIVYISPLFVGKKIVEVQPLQLDSAGWKRIAVMTISAQIATAPLLIYYFSNFTLTGVFANILILPLMPTIMLLGYSLGILYYIFKPIAVIGGWALSGILEYQLFVVDIFSKMSLPFNPTIEWRGIVVYYLILLTTLLVLYARNSKKKNFINRGNFITG